MKKILFLLLKKSSIVICILLLFSCSSKIEPPQPLNFTDFIMLMQLSSFDITMKYNTNSAELNDYFKDYFKIIPNLKIHSGYYFSNNELLAAHMLTGNSTASGTAIFIHGYLGSLHEANFPYFTKKFIQKNFKVILLNLPGHEFSGGYRGSINKFSDYRDFVRDFLVKNKKHFGPTTYMIGLSTGAISIFDSMRVYPNIFSDIDKVVLLSPFLYIKNRFILESASLFISSFHTNEYRTLGIHNLSTSWVRKASSWGDEQKKNTTPLEYDNVFLIFGGKDKVINLNKSKSFYKKVFPSAKYTVYKSQDHTFSREGKEKLRHDLITFFLEN